MEEQGLLEEIVTRLGVEVKALWSAAAQGEVAADGLEKRVQALVREAGRETVGVLLETIDRRLCQGRRLHDRRTRSMVTLLGPVDVTRGRLEGAVYPLDEALGLVGAHGWTRAVQEAVSLVACEKGFDTTSDLLARLLGLAISPPAAEQVAETAGARAGQVPASVLAPPVTAEHKTLVVAIDGCQAPQRDGWHEVKLADVYTNEHRVKTASGRGKIVYKEYVAALEHVTEFGPLLWQAVERWKIGQARRVVVMGDGAPWIWNLAQEHFPEAVEIVDFYHAAEHLWAAGEALYGERNASVATKSWVRRYLHRLRHGEIETVIAALARGQDARQAKLAAEARDVLRRQLAYFRTNAARMHYDRYKRLHLPIGTGAVEGSCKYVVQERFKLPGCRWSRAGLANMLQLKLLRLNHHWESLWTVPQAA